MVVASDNETFVWAKTFFSLQSGLVSTACMKSRINTEEMQPWGFITEGDSLHLPPRHERSSQDQANISLAQLAHLWLVLTNSMFGFVSL